MLIDLPQVTIPTLIYNALVCALATAIGWHALNLVGQLRNVARESLRSRNRDR
jgi:hypothetical protein